MRRSQALFSLVCSARWAFSGGLVLDGDAGLQHLNPLSLAASGFRAPLRHFHVFGLRSSGTTYLQQLLSLNVASLEARSCNHVQ